MAASLNPVLHIAQALGGMIEDTCVPSSPTTQTPTNDSIPVAIQEEEAAAKTLQALERGRQARKAQKSADPAMDLFKISRSANNLLKAKNKFKRLKPNRGALINGGFPGAPVNASMALALSDAPDSAGCYERVRDSILRFFVRHGAFFIKIAILHVILFVLDILVCCCPATQEPLTSAKMETLRRTIAYSYSLGYYRLLLGRCDGRWHH